MVYSTCRIDLSCYLGPGCYKWYLGLPVGGTHVNLQLAQSWATVKEGTGVLHEATAVEYQMLEFLEVSSGRQPKVEPLDEQIDRGGAFE